MTLDTFNKYCAIHRPVALKYAIKLIGNKAQAEDIVQEAMIKIYRAWDRFIPGDNPPLVAKRWLLHIVSNQFINAYNKRIQDRKQMNHVTSVMLGTYGQQEDGRDPRAMMYDGTGDEVEAAFAKLDPQFREVARRCDLDGQSYKEIAEETGVPLGTVMSRLHRARKALKPLLAEYHRTTLSRAARK